MRKRRLKLASGVIVALSVPVIVLSVPHMEVFDVRHVEVAGASAVPDPLVRRQIQPLLEGQTIFSLDRDAIEREVERLPFVREATIDRHLPGGLTVRVREYEPLAFALAGREGWLIARDGRVLAPARLQDWSSRAPIVQLDAQELRSGDRVDDEPALELLRVIPPTFPAAFTKVEMTPEGMVAELADGLELKFGPPTDLAVKLRVAQRLMVVYGVDRAAGGEMADNQGNYLDVSVPARPAVKLQ